MADVATVVERPKYPRFPYERAKAVKLGLQYAVDVAQWHVDFAAFEARQSEAVGNELSASCWRQNRDAYAQILKALKDECR